MKKTSTIALLFVLFTVTSYAQLSKGTILLGGDANVYTNTNHSARNSSESRSTNLAIHPNIGLFLTDRLVVGIRPGYSYGRAFSEYSPATGLQYWNRVTNNTLSIAPFGRIYAPLGERVSIFGQAYMNVSFGRRSENSFEMNNSSETRSSIFGTGLFVSPGLAFFATRRLGFEATFGRVSYSFDREKQREGNHVLNTWNVFNLALNPSALNIGIQYYISR